jgi:hypothetical protein
MATTTNYGWTTPDDTALVKDGASAIRTLGSSVDTTTKALNPSTTLGDIEYRSSTANTNTRLGIGSTGNVLTVSGGVPTWAAPASGGSMTQLATGTLSGTSVSLTSIDQTYQDLRLDIFGTTRTGSGSAGFLIINYNTITSSTYQYYNIGVLNGTMGTTDSTSNADSRIVTFIPNDNVSTDNFLSYTILNYTRSSSRTNAYWYGGNIDGDDASSYRRIIQGNGWNWNATKAAITSIQIGSQGDTFAGGTYTLYGVK